MKPKILLIHNFSSIRGGADRYVGYLKGLLEREGHKILSFTAEENTGLLPFNAKNAIRYLYNKRGALALDSYLKAFKPDIAHCHNIYGHLTPAILPVLKKHHLPVVMTLHDWKLICPNHMLFTQGKTCERCLGRHFYQSLLHRCFKNSLALSFLGMTESYLHHWMRIYEKNCDLFIAPSHFLRNKFLAFGILEDRLEVVPHFIELAWNPSREVGEGIVYFGEIREGKGIFLFFEALRQIPFRVKVKVIGEGIDLEKAKQVASSLPHAIEWFSFLKPQSLYPQIQSSLFTVLPSLWYENQPLSILESYAMRRPVVGSNHGGIAELIEDGKTGLLFKPGDAIDLASKLTQLLKSPERTCEMGASAGEKFEKEFNAKLHYERISKVYQRVLRSR